MKSQRAYVANRPPPEWHVAAVLFEACGPLFGKGGRTMRAVCRGWYLGSAAPGPNVWRGPYTTQQSPGSCVRSRAHGARRAGLPRGSDPGFDARGSTTD
jgi:hypothetical protein